LYGTFVVTSLTKVSHGINISDAKVKEEFSKIELDVGCVKDLTRHPE